MDKFWAKLPHPHPLPSTESVKSFKSWSLEGWKPPEISTCYHLIESLTFFNGFTCQEAWYASVLLGSYHSIISTLFISRPTFFLSLYWAFSGLCFSFSQSIFTFKESVPPNVWSFSYSWTVFTYFFCVFSLVSDALMLCVIKFACLFCQRPHLLYRD